MIPPLPFPILSHLLATSYFRAPRLACGLIHQLSVPYYARVIRCKPMRSYSPYIRQPSKTIRLFCCKITHLRFSHSHRVVCFEERSTCSTSNQFIPTICAPPVDLRLRNFAQMACISVLFNCSMFQTQCIRWKVSNAHLKRLKYQRVVDRGISEESP